MRKPGWKPLGADPSLRFYSLPEFFRALAGAYIAMCEEYEGDQ